MTTLKNANLDVIILAAGLGTRMKSATIKILHRAAGRPIIDYVLDLAGTISDRLPIMIIGHQRESVQKAVGERARFAVQEEQKGTGHAVLQAAPLVDVARHVLILSGDVPLTRIETLRRLLDEHERSQNALTLLTMKLDDPAMYGRIVRDGDGTVTRIVEAKDASDDEKRINEVNAGIYVFDGEHLFDNLRNLSTDNAQGEYYLTDLLGVLRKAGQRVGAVIADDPIEALGVNSRADLASVEGEIQRRVVDEADGRGRHVPQSGHRRHRLDGFDRQRHRHLSLRDDRRDDHDRQRLRDRAGRPPDERHHRRRRAPEDRHGSRGRRSSR